MQIPRWRNLLMLKNSILPALSSSSTTSQYVCFHSTPAKCEKWKNKWNSDVRGAQRPSKNYIRYTTRQKRADTKRALRNLLYNCGASRNSFQDEEPMSKIDGTDGWNWDDEEDDLADRFTKKGRSKSSRRAVNQKKRKGKKIRRESYFDDFDDAETIFQARFGNRSYTWSFTSRENRPRYQASGFEWREQSDWTKYRFRETDTSSDSETDHDSYSVGSSSDRKTLGLPLTGPLKMEDVKNAFRISALKWHPDKHQGPSQVLAEEKFKLCANAYKSLCNALA